MTTTTRSPHLPALAHLPQGLFLMTAQHESRRAGVVLQSVQACGDDPPLLSVTLRTGHWIEPLIRDAHCFAVCMLERADRLTLRKFVEPGQPREPGDPFDCMPVDRLVTGAPVIRRSIAAFDCEVVRHLDIDNEYGIYIGKVVASRVYRVPPLPAPLPMTQQPDGSPSRSSMTG